MIFPPWGKFTAFVLVAVIALALWLNLTSYESSSLSTDTTTSINLVWDGNRMAVTEDDDEKAWIIAALTSALTNNSIEAFRIVNGRAPIKLKVVEAQNKPACRKRCPPRWTVGLELNDSPEIIWAHSAATPRDAAKGAVEKFIKNRNREGQ